MASKESCLAFLSCLESFRNIQKDGEASFVNLTTALEDCAASKSAWSARKSALENIGVDSSFVDPELLEARDRADALMRAEQALCNLHTSIGEIQECCNRMVDTFNSVRDTLSEGVPPDGTDLFLQQMGKCCAMYAQEAKVKAAVVDTLTLDSSAPHATAMGIAWKHQPYIEPDAVASLVTLLDARAAAAARGAAASGPAEGSGSKKKKKR